jgi:thioredoxin-related protein
MKFFSFTLLFTLLFFQDYFAQDTIKGNSLNWEISYKEALKKSKIEKKPILIYFKGSDWCTPCKVIDAELLRSERFKELSDKNLVLLEVDIPRQIDLLPVEKMTENYTLQSKFKVKSFPTILIVDYKGKVLAEKKGYILTEYYFPFIEQEIRNYKS